MSTILKARRLKLTSKNRKREHRLMNSIVDPSVTPNIASTIERLARALQQRGWLAATAESCTGGLVSAALTDVAGSSNWFSHGVVSYSNTAKTALLGVPAGVIDKHGAVSEPVALAMVEGLLRQNADVAVSITGIAGPGGGSADKPVGTVWVGYGTVGHVLAQRFVFSGSRAEVREQSVAKAISFLLMCSEA